jgi:drug/metabolite transporter (DMT)-like permease
MTRRRRSEEPRRALLLLKLGVALFVAGVFCMGMGNAVADYNCKVGSAVIMCLFAGLATLSFIAGAVKKPDTPHEPT